MNAIKILVNALSLYKGTHLSLDEVKSTLVKKIEVTTANGTATPIEIDGELPGRLPAVFEVVPKAIRVRIPRKKAN
jgi:diacylglycerol kinase family enzyme